MMKKTANGFEAQARFNWGYHAGAEDVQGGRSVKSLSWKRNHFDGAYVAGYEYGVRDAENGNYAENSGAAWAESKRGRVAA